MMFDEMIAELDRWIDRLAPARVLLVQHDGDKWTAGFDGNILYRHTDRNAVVRFALTFAESTPGVTVDYDDTGYSVRVPPSLTVVQ